MARRPQGDRNCHGMQVSHSKSPLAEQAERLFLEWAFQILGLALARDGL